MPAGSITPLLVKSLSIILIDLLLAGDNALVIAMAVRSLPQQQRRIAIGFGAAAAVILRVGLTVIAAQLLNVAFLSLVGGVFVVWIAVKVLSDADAPPPEDAARRHLLQAIWMIVFADITMSLDNVLAVAGAARGSIPLIIFGLCVSIPFVVFSSNLIAKLMDRYSVIVYLGAAILGEVGGGMMINDPFVKRTLQPSALAGYAVQAAAAAAVVAVGRYLCKRHHSHHS